MPAFDPQAIRLSQRDYADVGQMVHFWKSGERKIENTEWTNVLSRTFQRFTDSFYIATDLQSDVRDPAMSGSVQLGQTQIAAAHAFGRNAFL